MLYCDVVIAKETRIRYETSLEPDPRGTISNLIQFVVLTTASCYTIAKYGFVTRILQSLYQEYIIEERVSYCHKMSPWKVEAILYSSSVKGTAELRNTYYLN